jgi:type I restriction enzyme S subunit
MKLRYEAYKDSGVEWLGDVPTSWTLNRHKDAFKFVSDRCVNSSFLKVALENIEGKTGRFISTESEFDGDGIKFKRNDILFGKLRPYLAKVYLADFDGNAIGDIFVYRPKRSVTPLFAQYLMLSDRFIDVINGSTAGAKMPRVSSNFIANLPVSIPSISEQTTITAYLDTKTAQIDRKIDLLSQKAAQYGKLKQSLINETVTRGLDKTVPMKDSGVEWIREVPAHWELKKLSQSFSQIGSGTTPKSGIDIYYEGGATNWINTGDLNDGILYNCKRKITNRALQDHSLTIYPAGSIIIAMYGATIGKVSISMIDGCTNQACCVLNDSKTINVRFLFYWFISKREYIISLSYGGGQPNISQDTIKNLRVISPSIAEQTAIANYLDEKTAHIDRIVAAINSQIDKLKELRLTLINDVVTGKIKVA